MNSGKIFERDFKDSCRLWIWRIPDTYTTVTKIDGNAFIPQMPSDFLVKNQDKLYFVELKHTNYNYITVQHDKTNGQIKKHQIDQMLRLSCDEVVGLFVLQFDEDTYAIKVQDLVACLEDTGKHSVNRLDIVQHGGVIIQWTLLRTHKRYELDKVFQM